MYLHIKCKAEKSKTLYAKNGKIWFSEPQLIKQNLVVRNQDFYLIKKYSNIVNCSDNYNLK